MKTITLFDETWRELTSEGYGWRDIAWIGLHDGSWMEVEDFKRASKFDYDPGFGSLVINSQLVIVMNDGSWFERGEYDGSEWWAYKKCPTKKDVDPTADLNLRAW